MRVRRKFGQDMHHDWQDRNPKIKEVHGFKVTFQDGHSIEHSGGLATLSLELIREHGGMKKAEVF